MSNTIPPLGANQGAANIFQKQPQPSIASQFGPASRINISGDTSLFGTLDLNYVPLEDAAKYGRRMGKDATPEQKYAAELDYAMRKPEDQAAFEAKFQELSKRIEKLRSELKGDELSAAYVELRELLGQNADLTLSAEDKIANVTEKYAEIRTRIEREFSGAELAEQLKALDDAFDTKFAEAFDPRAYTGVHSTGRITMQLQEHGGDFDIDGYLASMEELNGNIDASIKLMAEKAKEYVKNGGDKNGLLKHLEKSADEKNGVYSIDTIRNLNTILKGYIYGDPDKFMAEGRARAGTLQTFDQSSHIPSHIKDALSGLDLENSGIADHLKAALVRAATTVIKDDDQRMAGYGQDIKDLLELAKQWEAEDDRGIEKGSYLQIIRFEDEDGVIAVTAPGTKFGGRVPEAKNALDLLQKAAKIGNSTFIKGNYGGMAAKFTERNNGTYA